MITSGSNIKEGRIKEVEAGSIKPVSILKKLVSWRKALAINYQEPFNGMYTYCECCETQRRFRKYTDRAICTTCKMVIDL